VAEASDCRIQSNGQAGVVSKDLSSVVSLRGCEILNNGRMGVAAIVGGTVDAIRCSITANDRVGIGAWHNGSKVSLAECDVCNNGATGSLRKVSCFSTSFVVHIPRTVIIHAYLGKMSKISTAVLLLCLVVCLDSFALYSTQYRLHRG
jgi:hypothetical protein